MFTGARHIGQREPIADSVSTRLVQNRACPHCTSATPERGATKHTSQHVSDTAAAAAASVWACGLVDDDDAETVASSSADDCSSSLSSLSLLSVDGRNASVWAPMQWLTARRNWRRLYEPTSKRATHALMRVSFKRFILFFGRLMLFVLWGLKVLTWIKSEIVSRRICTLHNYLNTTTFSCVVCYL